MAVSIFLWWFWSNAWQRRRLHAKMQEARQGIVLEAETYATSLRCSTALVSASNFFALERLRQVESIIDDGKQRVLDTLEKSADFREKFTIVFLSQQWLAWTNPDPHCLHYKTICAVVDEVFRLASVSVDKIFLCLDFCSIPQDQSTDPGMSLCHCSSRRSCCASCVLDSAFPSQPFMLLLSSARSSCSMWCIICAGLASGSSSLFLVVVFFLSLQSCGTEHWDSATVQTARSIKAPVASIPWLLCCVARKELGSGSAAHRLSIGMHEGRHE